MRDVQHAVKQVERLARAPFGDEQPGEGELVVLGQIGGRIRRRDPALAGPRPRVVEAALHDPHPGPGRGDRPHVREVPGQEERLGLVEHRDPALEVAFRLQQGGRRGAPAVPVLQQHRRVAELAGDLEVLRGRLEVALLAQHVREADVHVAGDGEHRAGVTLGRGQRAFVESARLDRTSTCQPQVRQYDGGTQLVCDHVARAQAGDRHGERVDCSVEVAGGPGRQADEACAATSRDVVLRPGQRQCPAGMRDRTFDVAPGLGDRGAKHGDRGWERADLDLPAHGRLRQRGRCRDGRWRRPVQTGLGSVEPLLRPVDVARGEPAPPPHAASSGRRRTTSSGSAASQSIRVRFRRRRRRSARASSTRSAVCSWSRPAIACGTASASSPCSASHRLAAACSSRTRSASRAARRARKASAKRWW